MKLKSSLLCLRAKHINKRKQLGGNRYNSAARLDPQIPNLCSPYPTHMKGCVIADSYARSGHDRRLMDKVWMKSFVGEGLSCSLKGR